MQPVRLVLVEDVPTEAEIAVRHLEAGGFSCTWQRVDSEAVLRRTLIETRPDLILSDFTLPGFDGLTALEMAPGARARHAVHLPVRDHRRRARHRGTAARRLRLRAQDQPGAAGTSRTPRAQRSRHPPRTPAPRTAVARHRRDLAGLDLGTRSRRPLHLLQRLGAHHPRLCARGDARHQRLAVRASRRPGGARFRHAHAGSQPAHRHQPAGALAASQWQLPLAGAQHAGAARRATGRWSASAAANATSPSGAGRKNTSAA